MRRFSLALALTFSVILVAAAAGAQTQPPAMLGGPPAENFIGEGFCFDTAISNPGGDPGYGPYVRLTVPVGMTFNSATAFGMNLSGMGLITDVGVFPAAPGNELLDPLTDTMVSGPEGAHLYLLLAPVGSVVFGQPPTVINICMTIGLPPDTAVGTALDVTTQPVYLFGDTPTGDNGPIEGPPVTTPVTPTLMIFDKNAADGKNAAGPSDPAGYTLNVDVANQQTISNLVFTDTMPATFIYTGHTIGGTGIGCTTTTAPTAPSNGGFIEIQCTSVTGTTGAGEIVVTINGFADDILDHDNCDQQSLPNTATLDADYLATPLPQATGNASFTTRHLVIEKAASGTSVPGGSAAYSIGFQVSDYIAATNLVLVDVLPDGIDFDLATSVITLTVAGNTYAITPAVQQDTPGVGQTTLTFDIGAAILAGIPALTQLDPAATGTLTYTTDIQQTYDATGEPVLASDNLPNTVTGTYDIVGATNPLCTDTSSAGVDIVATGIDKTIVNPAPAYRPGDTVIFSLTMDIPAGNTSDIVFTDFLPLPIFDVNTIDPTWGGPDLYLGSGTTPVAAAIIGATPPTVVVNAGENSITLNFPDIVGVGVAQTIDARIEVDVTDLPFSDPLFLTNLFVGSSSNTPDQVSSDLIPRFLNVRAPELTITKGVFATSNSASSIVPAPPANPLDDPVEGDLTNGDALDSVTYVVTVENQGGAAAGNVRIWDDEPGELTACSLDSVRLGDGTVLSSGTDYTGDFFDSGNPLTLSNDLADPGPGSGGLAANDEDPATFGRDTAVIEFTCNLASIVEPREIVENKASALWTSRVGTPGTGDFPVIDDVATASMATIGISKTVLPLTATIGEIVTYEVTVTLPGGTSSTVTLTDEMPGGVAFVDCLSVTADPGITTSIGAFADACNDPTNPTVINDGVDVEFTLGTVTVPGSAVADSGEVKFTYTAVVLNTSNNNGGNNRRNLARWNWTGGFAQARALLGLTEPHLSVTKETSPPSIPPVDAGDTVSFQINVVHTASPVVPAYDVILEDIIPTGLTYVPTTLNCAVGTLVPDTCNVTAGVLTATWAVFPTTGVTVITFNTTVDTTVNPGTFITNTALAQWTSLSGPIVGPLSPYNTNSCERTSNIAPLPYCGTGNDYSHTDQAGISIASVGLTKAVRDTSEPSTGAAEHRPFIDDLTVGETATFHITATIPEGTTPQVIITDTLPYTNGIMEVVSAQLVSVGGNLLPDLDPPDITITDVQLGDGLDDTVTFDFGQVLNNPDGSVTPDDQLVVEVVGRLVDEAANINGDELTNSASVQFGMGLNATASAPVDVVEPLLRVVKTGNATEGDAGDTVIYTVTIDHVPPTPASTADAFDLVITDAIPAGMTYVAASLTDTGAVPADSLGEAAGTITATWDVFPQGSVGEFTFAVTIDPGAQPGSNLNNIAAAQWDTLPADSDPDERTLTASDNHSVLITSPGMTKVVFATSEPSTGNGINGPEPDLTIGEEVTYRFVATFHEGLTPTGVVEDQLPVGTAILSYVSSRVISIGANLSGPSVPSVGTAGTPSNTNADAYDDHVAWFLGDVTNAPDGVQDDDDRMEFEVVAVVVDEPINQGGLDDLANTATVSFTGGSASAVALVDMVEPELTLTKTVTDPADGFVDAGDTISVELLITHVASTADAFSTQITDVFPDPGLSWINDGTVSTTCTGGVVIDSSTDPTISFTIGSLPLAEGNCTVTYQARVDDNVQPSLTYTNLATLQWDSTPVFVAGSSRRQTTTATDTVTVLAPTMVKLAQSTSLADTGMAFYHPTDFDLAIGETVTYELTVVFPEGLTDTAVITDTLPADALGVIEAVGASISSLGANLTAGLPGTPVFLDVELGDGLDDTVVFDFGAVTNAPDGVNNADDRLVLLVVGRVVDVVDNSDSDWLSNTGTFTFASGGPLSDTAEIDVVEPVMAVTKNMGPVVNGLVTITVQLENSGTAPAYDIILEDILNDSIWNPATITPVMTPTGYTFSTAAGPGAGDTTVTMASDPLSSPPDNSVEPAEIIAFQFQVALADPANPPPSVPNTATNTQTTSLPGPDGNQRELPPTSDNDVLQLPILDAFKSAILLADNDGSLTVSPGDVLRYTITVVNSGAGAATLVNVGDVPDPNGLFLVGSVTTSPGGVVVRGNTAGDTVVEAVFPTLGAMGTATVTYDVAIPNPLASGITQLVNHAVIDSTETPPLPSDDPSTPAVDDPTVVPIDAAPDIAVSKTDGVTSTFPGDTLTYTITVQNIGNQDAINIVLTDTIPPGTSFVAASQGGAEVPAGSGNVAWPLFNLAAGSSITRSLTVAVLNPPPVGLTSILNTAVANDDGSNGPDPNPGNNTGTDTDVLVYSDLGVTKSDSPDPVVAGENLIWTITVTNYGVSDATGVILDDVLPPGVTLNTISPPCASGFPCSIGNLAVGNSVVVTVDVTVDSGTTGVLSNTATVTGNEVDSDTRNNSDTETTNVGQSTDLEVTKTDNPDPVVAGEPLTWTLTLTNNGPSDATGVVLDDTLPPEVTPVAISAPCAGGFPCTIGDLAAGDTVTVTIDVTVNPDTTGTVTNTADATGNEPDPDPNNNSVSEPTEVIPIADLEITKTGPGSVASGSDVVYTIMVANNGPSDAVDLLITDPTPAGLSFVSATSPCDSGFPCMVASLAAGANFSYDVTYAVPAGYTEPDPIINTTSVSSTVQDPDPSNNTSSSSTAVDRTPEADLEIIKTGPPSAAPGSTVTYGLAITNHGPDDAADVVLDDPTPTGLGFVSATAPCAGGFPCTIGTINADATVVVDVTFSIPPGYTTPDPIANTATVSSSTTDPDPGNNTSTETTPLGSDTADLAVTKLGPTQALPGDDVSYTITVTNNGPATATGVLLDDPTPADLTFVSATAPCASGFPCALGDILLNDSVIVSVTFNIPPGYAGADPVVNTATAAANEPDPDPTNNTASAVTGLSGDAADVGVVKTGPSNASPGTAVTFAITVTNYGPGIAGAVVLDDPAPTGLVFVTASAPCNSGFPCNMGDLASGSVITLQATFDIPADYTSPNPIVNTATVTTTSPDSNPANNSSSHQTAVSPVADLSVTKSSAPDPVVAGTALVWTITVANDGPSDATGVILDDVLPAGVAVTAISAPCAAGFPCTIGNMAAGSNQIVTIQVIVDPSLTGVIFNTATVTGNEPDPDPGNNSATDPTTVIAQADLMVSKTDSPDPVVAGTPLVWTVTVTNNGPSDATGVVLDDVIPAGVTVNSISAPCAAGFPCAIGNMAAGASVAVMINVTVDSGTTGMLTNSATVVGLEPDPDPSNNNTSEPTTVIAETDLQVIKTDNPDPVVAGEALTWTITVTNNGPSDATGVILDDAVPAGVTVTAISAPCTAGFPCAIGNMVAGASVMVTIDVTVDSGTTGVLTNIATVTGNETDPNPSNNTATEPTAVITETDLEVTKTDNPDPVLAGEPLTWTITVTNNGPSDATGVILDDTLPPEVTVTSISAPCAAGFPCTIGDIVAGDSVVVTVDVDVDPATTGTIINTATVSGNETDSDPSNNTATEPTSVDPEADLEVIKTASPEPVVAGDPLTWTITVTNYGPSDATGVVLEDVVPSEVAVTAISAPCGAGFPCTLGNLAVGASVVITIEGVVDINLQTPITNTATVNGNEPDPDPSNNSSTVVTLVNYVEIEVEKTVSDPPEGGWQQGDLVVWTMAVTNNGNMAGTGIVLTDGVADKSIYYPESMTLDSVSLTDADDGDPGLFSVADNQIVVDLDPVPAGGTRVVTFTVMISTHLTNGSHVIPNQATVTSPTGPVTSNTVVAQIIVQGIPTMGALGTTLLAILIGLAGVMVVRRRFI